MSQTPSQFINNPVSGVRYYSEMDTAGCIANNGTTWTCTCKAWTGNNGTGSLIQVTNLHVYCQDYTAGVDRGNFSGNFNTVNANATAINSTNYLKASGQFTGAQSVGSLELFIVYTGTAFVPTGITFSPSFGIAGQTVAISGSRFTDMNSVQFNGVSASFVINNDSSITATIPVGSTAGLITVGGSSGSANSAATFFPITARARRSGAWVIPQNIQGRRSSAWSQLLDTEGRRSGAWSAPT